MPCKVSTVEVVEVTASPSPTSTKRLLEVRLLLKGDDETNVALKAVSLLPPSGTQIDIQLPVGSIIRRQEPVDDESPAL